jgi:hypothetical protein
MEIARTLATTSMPLTEAAALAYRELTGHELATRSPEAEKILCDVASALAIVAPIFVTAGSPSAPRELPADDLIGATFQRAGEMLVLQDGTELRDLTVQRRDIGPAIEWLRRCGLSQRWQQRKN